MKNEDHITRRAAFEDNKCVCALGNPPCGYCENSSVCALCDEIIPPDEDVYKIPGAVGDFCRDCHYRLCIPCSKYEPKNKENGKMPSYEKYISATLKVLTALLKLGNWTIEVTTVRDDNGDEDRAKVNIEYRYQLATIYMPPNLPTPEVDYLLVHECLHLLFAGMANVNETFSTKCNIAENIFTDAEEHAIKTLEGIILEKLRQTIKDGVQ